MEFKNREFIPFLLGGDINTYSVARAFYEEYQVKTYVCGKFATGPSYKSKITEYKADIKIDTDEVFLKTVNGFADEHRDKKIILIGCGDSYVALISKHKSELRENIIAPYIDFELMNSLQQKETFYKLCEENNVAYPKTYVYTKEIGLEFEPPFDFPMILKPSDSINYWEHAFDTQKKVYIIKDKEELISVISEIYEAGYEKELILQDMIPGNDEYMRVLTCYSNKNAKVKMMCLGHVMLEEHTPHGMGNHSVIVTEPEIGPLMAVKDLLEKINYVGFSNFDIKFDKRDGKYKFFEINTRQGRSNYYVTNSGLNIAKYIVEEYIYNRELEFEAPKEEYLWMVVPKKVAFKHIKEESNRNKIKELINTNKWVNPIFKKSDNGLHRTLRMLKTHFKQFGYYDKYYK